MNTTKETCPYCGTTDCDSVGTQHAIRTAWCYQAEIACLTKQLADECRMRVEFQEKLAEIEKHVKAKAAQQFVLTHPSVYPGDILAIIQRTSP